MEILQGIPASKGIAIAPAFIYRVDRTIPARTSVLDAEAELIRLHSCLQSAKDELEDIYRKTLDSLGQNEAEIFHAQALMVDDPDLLEAVGEKIRTERINAAAAFYEAAESYAQMLQALPEEYFQARAVDVRDICRRVLGILQDETGQKEQLTRLAIILAEDLTPSDTMRFNRELIAGFFTAHGGATSHAAILSRALGVPAVVGSGKLPVDIDADTWLILDGEQGLLFVDPDAQTISEYKKRAEDQARKFDQDMQDALAPAKTKDGVQLEVAANIGSLEDSLRAVTNGAEGVGLLRTEFSYLERNDIPAEDELVKCYTDIFRVFGDHPVVVRTLDIGGDKDIPYLDLPEEDNPFLGCRGLRLCFTRPDLFKPQLRAILRAGVNTKLCIMFPMVSTVSEVRQARAILAECMEDLTQEGISFNAHPQVGIMIEVPAAAICADQLAKEVDFFSIGTNDLTQYTLAADRGNAKVSYLSSALQPAVLRLIQRVIEAGHAAGIWVGMCGEMAGEPAAIPILIGLGLDELSMNSPAIPQAKRIIRQWSSQEARVLAEQAIRCTTPEEVQALVSGWKMD